MTKLDLIIDLHRNSDRQGPGSENDTFRALEFMNLPTGTLQVADIGCGTGGQTLSLAKKLDAQITAIDLFPEFLKELDDRSEKLGFQDKIQTDARSMENLIFQKDSLDLIWSEGAIYNMGFEKGIREWNSFLKPGGYVAVSEITWITDARPMAIETFWTSEYAEIDTASNKIQQLESNGYTLVGYFYLSEDSWIKTYYEPMSDRFQEFLDRNENSELAKEVLEEYKAEIDLYHMYKAYFSFGFYIARKNEH